MMSLPSNVEIKLQAAQKATGKLVDVRDYSLQNLGDLKAFKSKKLEGCKTVIEFMHARLRNQRRIKSELFRLDDLAVHLKPRLQGLFREMPIHSEVLEDLTQLNNAFLPILDFLVCYKAELGLSLQRLVEAYNLVLLNQFEGYYRNEDEREVALREKQELLNKREQRIEEKKAELYSQ